MSTAPGRQWWYPQDDDAATGPPGAGRSGEGWAGDPWGPEDDEHVPAARPEEELSAAIDVALGLLDAGRRWDVLDVCRRMAHVDARVVLRSKNGYEPDLPLSEVLLTRRLLEAVEQAWSAGWQPADLVRLCERRGDRGRAALLRAVVGRQLARYPADTLDPRWRAQLRELGITPVATARSLLRSTPAGGLRGVPHPPETALALLHLLVRLPEVERLTPLPGTTPTGPDPGDDGGPGLDERLLARVRALLAKAESTPYPAEAETFTAGAQALMSRHSIDAAMLSADGDGAAGTGPDGLRIGVDPPYESPKAGLLSAVAHANDCRSVWSKDLGFCTVVGFDADLRAVEAVYTSLLVQATAALRLAAAGPSGRSRTFRQSFLLAFATRMHERLLEAAGDQREQAAAELGEERLLPVLARRSDEVEEAFVRMFPGVRTQQGPSRLDGAGWASGWAAADRAALGPGLRLEP